MFEIRLINDDPCPEFAVCPDLLVSDNEICIYMLNINTIYIKYTYHIYIFDISLNTIYNYIHIVHINLISYI